MSSDRRPDLLTFSLEAINTSVVCAVLLAFLQYVVTTTLKPLFAKPQIWPLFTKPQIYYTHLRRVCMLIILFSNTRTLTPAIATTNLLLLHITSSPCATPDQRRLPSTRRTNLLLLLLPGPNPWIQKLHPALRSRLKSISVTSAHKTCKCRRCD